MEAEAPGVMIKAEVVRHPGRDPKNNPRFVVTNLPDQPEAVHRIYGGRGDVENRLKELHHGLEMNRTSCSRFLAKQFRLLLTQAAYVLFSFRPHRGRNPTALHLRSDRRGFTIFCRSSGARLV
jgi:hypothetical protein